jgi:pectate lyase
MKYLRQIFLILAFLLMQNANATLWFEDGITGTVGNGLGAAPPYSPSSSQIKIAAGNLAYPNLANPSPNGNEFTISGASASSTFCTNTGSTITSGSVYYAFLAQCTTLPSSGGNYVTDLHTNATLGSGDPADIYVKLSGTTNFVMGVRKSGGSATYASSPTALNLNTTYLVVLKYTFNNVSAGDDTVTLYINPTPGNPESGATAEVTVSGGTDAAGALQYIGWKSQSSATGGAWIFDTIRVASTWAEVIPASTAPPSIINDLTNQAVSLGQNVTFSVNVSGTLPLIYQWYYNTSTLLSVGTNSTLTLTNVQLSDAGGYSVIVTNSYGSTNSAVAQLTVNIFPPSIDLDPQDQSALVGQNTSFSVQASGTAPLSYQWYYNTNTILTNATNSILTLTNVQLTDSGGYSAVVTNVSGSITSAVAQLTVSLPVAPSIITQPQDQSNILPGATATFSVIASGSDPLSYQWYYNNSTLLTNATDAILTIANVQPGNAGSYSVIINNQAGSITSSNAFLTVNTNPVAPVFNSQPASLVVLAGSTASFTAVAGGTAPISYQWSKNGTPIPGATSTTLNLSNVQTTDDGSYTLTASNSVGTATSNPAQLTVTTAIPVVNSAYNLVGFGRATTGGGVIPETDPAYRKVTNALDLANAILSSYKTAGSVKVIEIMNDLDLGWKEVGSNVQTLASTPFRSHATPKLHPRLIVTGVSLIDIKPKSGLTIFSANGATIRHACFNIKSTANIIVRNLKFDEMWEWDEDSKGNYDGNDWDFIDLGNAGTVNNIWIDHCTFTKAYDGIVDVKKGSYNITFSWNRYTGDDGATNPNSFVWQQINSLESNKTAYAMYNSLRTTSGFSTTNIVTIIQGHDKTHLVGANDGVKNSNNAAENAQHSLTFHHQWFQNCWDRCVPRLRGGSVHNFNIYVDDTLALAAKRLRDQHTVSSSYSFNPFLNGSISTESGAILLEKSVYKDCLTPLRNNQTDVNNSNYTGKIVGLDMIYYMDSTYFRGNSTDPGGTNTLGPVQAPIIPFSWNTNAATPNGQLPYTYTMDDPSQLSNIVTSATAGAGAGVLTWNKTNWLMTAYAATAPTIVADPQSQTNSAGQSATFTVAAGGSAPLSYQWYLNTNTPIANATNDTLTLANLKGTNAGIYSVIVTNVAGSASSAYALLTVTAANTAPTLTPVPDTNIIAGVTINITNAVTDPDLPPQTLTFSLLSAPGSATLDANSGVFSWRPLISQAGTTNLITVKVADNGTPILSATQSFHVIVSAPVNPQTPAVTFSNGQFGLTITGDIGPDYIVLASTNMTDWAGIFTNPMPFTWTDTAASNFSQRFYWIQLGP